MISTAEDPSVPGAALGEPVGTWLMLSTPAAMTKRAAELGYRPRARFVSFALAGVDPIKCAKAT